MQAKARNHKKLLSQGQPLVQVQQTQRNSLTDNADGGRSETIIRGKNLKSIYYGPNWKSIRKKVRERDNFTCQRCGITEKKLGHALPVHHIIPLRKFDSWKEANVFSNLVSLCPKCHGTVEQHGMDFDF